MRGHPTPCLALIVLIALTFTANSCASGAPTAVIARVGRKQITAAAVSHWATIFSGGPNNLAITTQTRAWRRAQALQFLISSIWLCEQAAMLGVAPSQPELDRRIAAKRAAAGSGSEAAYRAYLRTTGQTLADVLREARYELAAVRLQQAIRAQAGKVSAGEVAAYYKHHRQRFLIPERRDVELSNKASRASAERLKRRVQAGRSLLTAAERKAGEGSFTASNGAKAARRHPLERAIYAARPNVLTGPIYDGVDYDLFIVDRIVPAHQQTLAQVRTQIARQLTAERLRRTRSALTRSWMGAWTSKTYCSPGYIVSKCRQYRGTQAPENPFSSS